MKTRVIAAVVLIPVLLAVLFIAPPIVMAILLGILCAIAAYELLAGTGMVKHVRMIVYTMIVAFVVPLWCFFGMVQFWGLLVAFMYLAVMFGEILASHGKLRLEKISICAFGGLIIPYFFSALVRIMGDGSLRFTIVLPFLLSFLSDTGAYFIGCAFGRHKLAPNISPNKSIEGLVGGVAFAVLGMLLYCLIVHFAFDRQVNYLYALTYGIVGAFCGTFGDLSFSAIKRQAGIKDYGNLIPGHGGVLDRFDSVIFVAPLTEILLTALPVLV